MKRFGVLLCAAFVVLGACSSVPKRPVETFAERNTALNQLNLANRTANQGYYEEALLILEESRQAAVRVDDPSLLVKTAIARGNILFALGRHDEAFAEWEAARAEAVLAGETELAALVRIYMARGRLMLLDKSNDYAARVGVIRDEVAELTAGIKNDKLAQATGNAVLALAEKELTHFSEAETAVKRALEFHERERYLEEAAYDWYLLASIYSVSGRYDQALAALRTAVDFDRRAENSFGVASSWQATGEVYLRMNRREDAALCFNRAAAIFRAAGLEDRALKAGERAAASL